MSRKRQVAKQIKQAPRPAPDSRDSDGVDRSLVRWMLSLSPAERLRAAQGFANSRLRLRARRTTL